MSAIPTDEIDASLDIQQQQNIQQVQPQQPTGTPSDTPRKPKAPSVRRACVACHTGKTRCSEVLPCQSCLKRGLGASCAYPDPDAQDHSHPPRMFTPIPSPLLAAHPSPAAATPAFNAPPPIYAPTPNLNHTQYYDYNGAFTGASSSTFRPSKRPRNLTEEEAAAITRNFSRGDFYVGSSAPVRIDPRLPVRLTLGEGDHVHFTVGEALV
ncbi:uncharacterized protein ARMOST_09692 [Armillaria ostoyae]|uniref:Zn(2)-C6 fungal-type domain-containing protein n=2 Tax=Armillaria TaxID=47424 RepID=A0A284RC58_ARMOS|nr:hypothetical protein ARMSODRAFT_969310 [Armillaria solidipes]SJL06356.1 uncharacterized protein ARMOST_09692 [Armillaria ostoyae]